MEVAIIRFTEGTGRTYIVEITIEMNLKNYQTLI